MDTLFALPYGPLVIFLIRIVDVSLGTIRMITVVRGQRLLSAGFGFVEVLLWVVAVGYALQHLGSVYHIVGYAAGFAAGTYVGMLIEEKIALGLVVVRAVVPDANENAVARRLREHGYAVTEIDGHGREGPVDILNTVIERREARDVVNLIEDRAPSAFVTVGEIRAAHHGWIRPRMGMRREALANRR